MTQEEFLKSNELHRLIINSENQLKILEVMKLGNSSNYSVMIKDDDKNNLWFYDVTYEEIQIFMKSRMDNLIKNISDLKSAFESL